MYGPGVGPIVDIVCLGNETRLTDCQIDFNSTCPHSQDAGVRCRYNGEKIDIAT